MCGLTHVRTHVGCPVVLLPTLQQLYSDCGLGRFFKNFFRRFKNQYGSWENIMEWQKLYFLYLFAGYVIVRTPSGQLASVPVAYLQKVQQLQQKSPSSVGK